MRFAQALLLVLPYAIAENLPTVTFTRVDSQGNMYLACPAWMFFDNFAAPSAARLRISTIS
jgi:hypothetical protein